MKLQRRSPMVSATVVEGKPLQRRRNLSPNAMDLKENWDLSIQKRGCKPHQSLLI